MQQFCVEFFYNIENNSCNLYAFFVSLVKYLLMTTMATKFGQFLEKRAVNKSKLAEKTGITRQRLSELSVKENAEIRLKEAYAIAKAFDMDLNELSKELLFNSSTQS